MEPEPAHQLAHDACVALLKPRANSALLEELVRDEGIAAIAVQEIGLHCTTVAYLRGANREIDAPFFGPITSIMSA